MLANYQSSIVQRRKFQDVYLKKYIAKSHKMCIESAGAIETWCRSHSRMRSVKEIVPRKC
ncbi:hypothetical protein [Microcoleus vaginatus]|uniref:hypothetical protein n=1 Tax=Microcoleus vaginatus TaxID=119532 RepID=UPI001F6166D7